MSPGGSGSEKYGARYYWKALIWYAVSPLVFVLVIGAIIFPGIATYAILAFGAIATAFRTVSRRRGSTSGPR